MGRRNSAHGRIKHGPDRATQDRQYLAYCEQDTMLFGQDIELEDLLDYDTNHKVGIMAQEYIQHFMRVCPMRKGGSRTRSYTNSHNTSSGLSRRPDRPVTDGR